MQRGRTLRVERLVLEPVEDHLAEVDEILHTEGTANSEVASARRP